MGFVQVENTDSRVFAVYRQIWTNQSLRVVLICYFFVSEKVKKRREKKGKNKQTKQKTKQNKQKTTHVSKPRYRGHLE